MKLVRVEKNRSLNQSNFWDQIKNYDDDFTSRKKSFYQPEEENE